jgi:polyhydroxyalkanoate synthesis repressor PhaR
MIVIKKYENRRLYDTTNSRYVNLEEIAQLLHQGNEVQVIDAASGEDLTRLILTQIIVEDAKAPESSFPLDLLRQMVVATGRASQENALQYMKTMLEIYQNAYRAIPTPLNPFAFVQSSGASREEPKHGSPSNASNSPSGPGALAGTQTDAEQVQELKSRLADLEKQVSNLVDQKKTRKRKSNGVSGNSVRKSV